MKRLTYNTDIQTLLENLTEENKCYWRYQGAHHNGVIPAGQQSHERIFEGEAPEHVEEGVSCYDNPLQLFKYMQSDFAIDMDKTDVVLFIGKHMGYGLDEEDIVMVEEESDCMYSLSAKDFYRFLANADIYYNNTNLKEYYMENCGMEF